MSIKEGIIWRLLQILFLLNEYSTSEFCKFGKLGTYVVMA